MYCNTSASAWLDAIGLVIFNSSSSSIKLIFFCTLFCAKPQFIKLHDAHLYIRWLQLQNIICMLIFHLFNGIFQRSVHPAWTEDSESIISHIIILDVNIATDWCLFTLFIMIVWISASILMLFFSSSSSPSWTNWGWRFEPWMRYITLCGLYERT